MSDFLYELSHLVHCKHFVDTFSLIIVIVTSRNITFFVLMKRKAKLYMWAAIFHIMSKSFTMNFSMKLGALQEAFLIEFLKNSILWQHEDSAERICQIVIISHNSARYQKLNICIVWYITNQQNSWISKFILPHFTTKLEMFFLKHHFLGKSEMRFLFDWDLLFSVQ